MFFLHSSHTLKPVLVRSCRYESERPLGSTQCINRVGFLSFSLHQEQKTLDLLHKRYMKERSERVERETITTSVGARSSGHLRFADDDLL